MQRIQQRRVRILKNIYKIPPKWGKKKKVGLVRDLNPGPLAPKARIIPLDQRAALVTKAIFSLVNMAGNR